MHNMHVVFYNSGPLRFCLLSFAFLKILFCIFFFLSFFIKSRNFYVESQNDILIPHNMHSNDFLVFLESVLVNRILF
jgi:hypothetical protein